MNVMGGLSMPLEIGGVIKSHEDPIPIPSRHGSASLILAF
jgi:hypothetical protein